MTDRRRPKPPNVIVEDDCVGIDETIDSLERLQALEEVLELVLLPKGIGYVIRPRQCPECEVVVRNVDECDGCGLPFVVEEDEAVPFIGVPVVLVSSEVAEA